MGLKIFDFEDIRREIRRQANEFGREIDFVRLNWNDLDRLSRDVLGSETRSTRVAKVIGVNVVGSAIEIEGTFSLCSNSGLLGEMVTTHNLQKDDSLVPPLKILKSDNESIYDLEQLTQKLMQENFEQHNRISILENQMNQCVGIFKELTTILRHVAEKCPGAAHG